MGMFETLGKIMAPTTTLKIECGVCGHRVEWRQAEAFRRLTPDATPYTARRMLTCRACGTKGQSEVWL